MNGSLTHLIGFLLISISGFGQIMNPVEWSFTSNHLQGDEYELVFKARIDGDWNIYSQYIDEGGPVPTNFQYDNADDFELTGKNQEVGNKKAGFDALFDMQVIKFAKKVDFVQKVKVKDIAQSITGKIEFMVCNEESCLPPRMVDFSISLAAK